MLFLEHIKHSSTSGHLYTLVSLLASSSSRCPISFLPLLFYIFTQITFFVRPSVPTLFEVAITHATQRSLTSFSVCFSQYLLSASNKVRFTDSSASSLYNVSFVAEILFVHCYITVSSMWQALNKY